MLILELDGSIHLVKFIFKSVLYSLLISSKERSFYFEDRYAFGEALPIIDNTTADWIALQGREYNGWTAIQFTRLLDTCDPMDVAIKVSSIVDETDLYLSSLAQII